MAVWYGRNERVVYIQDITGALLPWPSLLYIHGLLRRGSEASVMMMAMMNSYFQVKTAISKEKYAVFSSSIKEYRSKHDFEKLMKVMPTIFSNDPAQQALMKSKSSSVKRKDN